MEFFYVVVVLLILAVVQAQVYKHLGFRGLDYDCKFSESEASEGDEIKLVETVSNHKMLPLPWLRSELTTTELPKTDAASNAVNSTSAAVRPGRRSRFLIGR